MKKDKYIIDAYNVIYAWKKMAFVKDPDFSDIDFAAMVSSFADCISGHVVVVFDGNTYNADDIRSRFTNIKIVFSSKDASADSIIEKMGNQKENNERIIVITSDRIESYIASEKGSQVLSPRFFWDIVSNKRKELDSDIASLKAMKHKKGFTIEDLIDHDL